MNSNDKGIKWSRLDSPGYFFSPVHRVPCRKLPGSVGLADSCRNRLRGIVSSIAFEVGKRVNMESPGDTVDGRNPAIQLRLIVYLIISTGFYTWFMMEYVVDGDGAKRTCVSRALFPTMNLDALTHVVLTSKGIRESDPDVSMRERCVCSLLLGAYLYPDLKVMSINVAKTFGGGSLLSSADVDNACRESEMYGYTGEYEVSLEGDRGQRRQALRDFVEG